MPTPSEDKIRRVTRKKNIDMPALDVNEYLQHPPLIKKLDEDRKNADAKSASLESELRSIKAEFKKTEMQAKSKDIDIALLRLELKMIKEDQLKEKDTKLALLSLEMKMIKDSIQEKERYVFPKALLLGTISLVATLLFSLGVNWVTATYDNITGWTMIAAAGILQIIAFFFNVLPQSGGSSR